MALAVVAGALASLGRVPYGPGVLNSIWAEDGSNFLTDALYRNEFKMILRPHNGYFVMATRALAIPASWAPIEWGPAVLTIEAALVTGLMALGVYLASHQHLRHPLARLIAAAPVVAVPLGENVAAAASNNVATLQFAAIYTAMWMMLWVPRRRASQVVAVLAVLAVAMSSFLAVILLPLALLRLYARRGLAEVTMVAGLLVALAGNLGALALGLAVRPVNVPSNWDPWYALKITADWALPHAMFGYGITGDGTQAVQPAWLVQLSWAVLALFVVVAAVGLTRPAWKIAALMGLTAIVFVCATEMQYGGLELRYVIAPELMLFVVLAALMLPKPDSTRRLAVLPLVLTFVGVGLVFAFSYQTVSPRANALAPWDEAVARARITCQDPANRAVYIDPADGSVEAFNGEPSGFPGWSVLVPCDRLR
ncbi:hypothetical protein Rhe02_17620 [Rhizocola hellebori]|uniref:Uncharacterized protein n=2 Tax=Rhizocola hellebori TaxID=1392758 RepID=A0A8J3Q5R4_9ACTN|nr:hypothetical protein Rhe02_17620 [Rhizocola hellebori]